MVDEFAVAFFEAAALWFLGRNPCFVQVTKSSVLIVFSDELKCVQRVEDVLQCIFIFVYDIFKLAVAHAEWEAAS